MLRGTSTEPAGELLQSSEMSRHFRALTERFSLVLVDSPPVNVVADAHLLAAGCDAVLLIARAFATTRKALEKAADDLRPFRILGTVLNGGTHAQLYRGYGNY
jgi:Mrp family chromosome partitioning ATPase